ncbi:AfsR/SARP family transcriptional regulator [Yinghuangia seranimata]|uniref:AfsR/SARP family transcriptional regulator n=1 Tax=Yinghuangia seranimata TaxID=408067 RepID=UPI00248B1F0D|nr:BTAD domain-containing putative transcriptional regulator [Yinghuangia seranimata]MDI2130923.1 tetratricopeptide repeat protein [Yinghuangia seranimata]
MTTRFTVLGPVEVSAAGRRVPGAAPRHRAVLGYLLLHAGTVVGADRLISAVWGFTPPDTARAQIHAAVTAIRRVLRTADPDAAAGLLATHGAGYLVQPGPGQLDLHEFADGVAAAHTLAVGGDRHGAAEALRDALALWRGVPFADVHADYVAGARGLLEDRRLGAVERLADLELGLGRHEELVERLTAETAAAPVRERLCGHLMLALHRSGRQADALAAARTLRAALAEQQGLDPGRAFTALEQAILRDDPALAGPLEPAGGIAPAPRPVTHTPAAPQPVAETTAHEPPPRAPRGSTVVGPHAHTSQASANQGGRGPAPAGARGQAGAPADPSRPEAGPRRANFLPYDTPDFAGRVDELRVLDGLTAAAAHRAGTVTVTAVDGMAGIGKTAFAIHAAHRLADRYPDGQLFVDLQAHTAGRAPVDAAVALEILLRQLGVPGEAVPDTVGERAARWRAELAGRRVVVVLDNAADADHVRPLLPGGTDSLVLITSRRRLVDLDGVRALSLELLPAQDAVDLFGSIVGERADAEPMAVMDVLQLCGFLPLAVRIAAARLHHRRQWTVGYLAGRLRDQRRRLAELSTSERGVAAAFTLSYQHLGPDRQRMFRLLGLHPGRDVDAYAAAALADVGLDDAETLLEDLLDAHVLLQHEPGRYTFHDLLREHARETAAEETDEDRRAALTRLVEHYLHTAATATDMVFPYCEHLHPPVRDPGTPAVDHPDAASATAWLDAERANLLAAVGLAADGDRPEHAALLSTVLRSYFDLDRRPSRGDAVALHDQAVRASRRHGHVAGECAALTSLGWVHLRQGDTDEALSCSHAALALCAETGDRFSEARAHNTIGRALWARGDHQGAQEHLGRALDIARASGNRVGEAHVLGGLGLIYEAEGDYGRALDQYTRSLRGHRELGNRGGEAMILDHLGKLARKTGDGTTAREHHRRARDLYRALGSRGDEAGTLNGLGEAALALGDADQAAVDHHDALTLAEEAGNRDERHRAHLGLAAAARARGDEETARTHDAAASEPGPGPGSPGV